MIKHPSQKLPTNKRDRLFEIARQEFTTHGFAQASLNRIVSEVGMSKSSFYHYFENKEDLFRQTLDQALAPFVEVQDNFDFQALSTETFWPSVRMMNSEIAHMANRSPELVLVGRMFYRSLENPEEQALTKEFMDMTTNWLAGLIRRGQDLGLVRDDLPESFVIETVMALGMSMDRWVLRNWDTLSDDERLSLSEQSFDLFVRLLAPG